jgi:uncharacterized protein (TIGR02145 family)
MKIKLTLILSTIILIIGCKKENNHHYIDPTFNFTTEVIAGISYRCVEIDGQIWMAENLRTRLSGGKGEGVMTYKETDVDAVPKSQLIVALRNSLNNGGFDNSGLDKDYIEFMMDYYVIPEYLTAGGRFYLFTWDNYFSFAKTDMWMSYYITELEAIGEELKRLEDLLIVDLISQAADYDYANKYGYLYTLDASKNVIPEGWRLPTDEDWSRLEKAMGMSENEISKMEEWRGDIGNKLKSNSLNNSFNATLGGAFVYGNYDLGDNFIYKDMRAYWWSSTKYATVDSLDLYVIRGVRFDNDKVLRGTSTSEAAYNIRLVKNK